ncbi:MAG: hypothetical protein P4L67_03600 [Candidatus Pacebacteria bacterium]|nr:hypothetical protein [Candidatus Paceibacterota bacterium]
MIMLERQKDSKALVKELSKLLKDDDVISEQEAVLGAKVPILKIIEKETGLPIDISFNAADGYKAIEPIKELMKRYPPLKSLTLVIKAFLRERRLNETYTGGIGSFLLVTMIVAFIQFECKDRKKNLKETNLGELLIHFFRFYGSEFNHVMLGISVVGDGTFYKKKEPDITLSVENPMDIDSDVGKQVRHYNDVVKTFQFASDLLRYTGASLGGILHGYRDRRTKKDSAAAV